jgi:hypothetical protein
MGLVSNSAELVACFRRLVGFVAITGFLTAFSGLGMATQMDPSTQATAKTIVAGVNRTIPGESHVREESVFGVLYLIALEGLVREPNCQDYRIEGRNNISATDVAGHFKEIWVVAVCGHKLNFEISRRRFGYRHFAISVKLES